MVDVTTDIVINRPREEVAAYAMDPDKAPEWYVNIKSIEWKTEKPLAVGSELAFKAEFLGRKLAYIYRVEELDTGNKLVMRTSQGPFPMETTYTWTSQDDQTTFMTLRNTGLPKGFSRVFAPMMKFMMKRANNKDLQKIKDVLENHDESAA